ncbi:alpha/beta fold hydrolase [Amnibacterium sp.]|uniref:alpha/beta fold hydrolase n=1 Tax=Amnibacterium sp. TaxID=1872496 RepID=UPI00261E597E|nr:alpha/beta hydrolase [Amnibacterium sp.]MCU1473303.1 alpha/beta hydrolase [Amnibacterium sp.]
MTEFVQSADGTAIAYEVHGTGPTVVLVDGAMCFRGSGPMRGIADAIGDALRVVLYDRRGRGASGDTAPFAVEREVEDLAAIAAAAGGPVALFGMSSGGALALRAAAALDAVNRVAVYEPPFMPEPALPGALAYTAELGETLDRGDRGAAVEAFLRRVGMPPEAVAGMRHSPGWAGMEALAPTLAYDDAAMGDSRVPALDGLDAEVLALAGGASPGFLQYGARAVAEASGGRFEQLAGQTHDIAPGPAAEALVAFVR